MTGSGEGRTPSVEFGIQDRDQPAGRVAALLLEQHLERFRALEDAVRAGEDPEALHELRVHLRSARSILGSARRTYPAEERDLLRALLAELASVTAPVRDLDVLLDRLPGEVERVAPVLRPGALPLGDELASRRERAQRELERWIASDTHASLRRRWQLLASVHRVGGSEPGPDALVPAGVVADRALARSYRRVVEHGAELVDSDRPEDWHRLRKRLKRLRYVLVAVEPLYAEGRFDELGAELSKLQDRFGDLQDHLVHSRLLLEAGRDLGGDAALTAGAMVDGLERRAARDLRRCRSRIGRLERRRIRRSIPDDPSRR